MTEGENLFRGKLVRLVAPSEGDAPVLARWSEDAGYLRAVDSDYARPLSAQEFAQRLSPDRADPNRLEFHIRTLHDDRLIGFVALHSLEWNNGVALLAIGIGEPEYRGKGYGTDALHLMLRFAFHELNLFRVGLDVIAGNTRAVRTYEKLGFRREGCMRGAVLRDGIRTDRITMGILRDEWVQAQATVPGDMPATSTEHANKPKGIMMSYYFGKTLDLPFDEAIARVVEELKKEGFGVLTEIDVKATLKTRLGVDFRNYRILGACNPSFAYQALQTEDKIGTMLSCNVIVQETPDGAVEVAAVDPIASMQAVDNPALGRVAGEVQARLKRVIASL